MGNLGVQDEEGVSRVVVAPREKEEKVVQHSPLVDAFIGVGVSVRTSNNFQVNRVVVGSVALQASACPCFLSTRPIFWILGGGARQILVLSGEDSACSTHVTHFGVPIESSALELGSVPDLVACLVTLRMVVSPESGLARRAFLLERVDHRKAVLQEIVIV